MEKRKTVVILPISTVLNFIFHFYNNKQLIN